MVKVYPLLSAAWGVLLFSEFKGVNRAGTALMAAMCGTYLLGVALLSVARNHAIDAQ
jgi:hypothetical protein